MDFSVINDLESFLQGCVLTAPLVYGFVQKTITSQVIQLLDETKEENKELKIKISKLEDERYENLKELLTK